MKPEQSSIGYVILMQLLCQGRDLRSQTETKMEKLRQRNVLACKMRQNVRAFGFPVEQQQVTHHHAAALYTAPRTVT